MLKEVTSEMRTSSSDAACCSPSSDVTRVCVKCNRFNDDIIPQQRDVSLQQCGFLVKTRKHEKLFDIWETVPLR